MIRKANRAIKSILRPIRLSIGKLIWDRKPKAQSENYIIDGKLDMGSVKSVLIMRYDGKIGDMIITSLLFREIKKAYPHIKIGVVTKGAAVDIIKSNKNVDRIYLYDKKNIENVAKQIADEKYDVLLDFTNVLKVTEMKFINLCKAAVNIGLNKDGWKMFTLSVRPSVDFGWNDHITQRYKAYLTKLNITNPSLLYDIVIPEDIRQEIKDYISTLPSDQYIVLNPFGASKHRTFNIDTIDKIINLYSDKTIVMIYSPDKIETVDYYTRKYENVFAYSSLQNILQSAELIRHSELLLTPDTAVVHVAVAFNVPLLAVYTLTIGKHETEHVIWSPLSSNAKVVLSKEKASKYDVADVNTFDFDELKQLIQIQGDL